MPKIIIPMPTAKNGFHILNLHPKEYIVKKIPFFNANLLEKLPNICAHIEAFAPIRLLKFII